MQLYIISLGYGNLSVADVARLTEETGLDLNDLRIKPWGKNGFTQNNLQSLLGGRYIHCPEMGNINYRGGPTKLVNPDRGVEILVNRLIRYGALITMCVCSSRSQCHRKDAEELIIETAKNLTGADITVIPTGSKRRLQEAIDLVKGMNNEQDVDISETNQTSLF